MRFVVHGLEAEVAERLEPLADRLAERPQAAVEGCGRLDVADPHEADAHKRLAAQMRRQEGPIAAGPGPGRKGRLARRRGDAVAPTAERRVRLPGQVVEFAEHGARGDAVQAELELRDDAEVAAAAAQ